MKASISKDYPNRKIMWSARVPWAVLDEALFHAWHQRIKNLTDYVIEALKHFNAHNSKLDSRLSMREQEQTQPKKMRV